MKHVKHGKKLISLLLSAAVAMSMTLSTVMTPLAASSSVSDLRQRLQELQTEQEKVNQQLKDAQSNKADAEALKTQLEQQKALILSQISNLSEQIGSLDEEIVNKQDEIDRKQQEVDQKQAEYDQRWADFKDRMRAMQRLNDGGSIALLSSATNLYQLLTFATTLDQIVNKDEDTCQQLENEHAELEQQRAELEQAKADLEATQADLETQKTALDGKTNELAQNISQTDANISAADAEIEANKAALIEANKAVDKAAAELDAALNAANQAYGNASIQCSLDFGRPLATYKYVSCYFGGNGHRGTDYAAPGGTEIYAVSGGVVTAAAYHWSWGYYVQVYHGKDDNGNTYSTLYAHMNSTPPVSVGQNVSQGDVIGHVGTTGNSTGNHLHLELFVDGALTDTRTMIPYDNTTSPDLHLTTTLDFICPLESYTAISAPFRTDDSDTPPHLGVDFAAAGGTPVQAAQSGVVTQAGWDDDHGYFVTIYHGANAAANDDGTYPANYATSYAHLQSKPAVQVGQRVAQGDVISARGLGKFEVAEVGGLSKKGRTALLLHRYL